MIPESTIPAAISEPVAFTIFVAKDLPETDTLLSSSGAILELRDLLVTSLDSSDILELLLPTFVAESNVPLILFVTPCAALFILPPVSFNLFVKLLKSEIFATAFLAPPTTSPTPAYAIIC